jgi:septum formation protein
MSDPSATPLILASRSEARAAMLRAAGVTVEILPAAVDEAAIKQGLRADGASPRDIADALAEFKARRIAGRASGLRVLGADQVLVCEGALFDKPASVEEAREQLAFLRGRDHELLSAAVIYEDAAPVWRHVGRAVLRVRPFSDAFLDDYVARQGPALLTTVGAYRLESEGAQLFSHVQGDYFTILGLPLLEVLGFLRTRGMLLE